MIAVTRERCPEKIRIHRDCHYGNNSRCTGRSECRCRNTDIVAAIRTYIRGGTLPGALLVCEHAGACLGGAHGEAERRGEREGDEDELHVGFLGLRLRWRRLSKRANAQGTRPRRDAPISLSECLGALGPRGRRPLGGSTAPRRVAAGRLTLTMPTLNQSFLDSNARPRAARREYGSRGV